MRPSDWGLLGCLSVLWGSSFFWSVIALEELETAWIVSFRLILAALILWVAVLVLRRPLPNSWRTLRALAALAIINNFIPFTFYTLSLSYIDSFLAAVLNAFTPLSVLILSQIFRLEDRMTWFNSMGCILGLLGASLLLTPGLMGAGWELAIGAGCAILAAICYGLGSLYARRHRTIDPYVMALGMVAFAALYSIPVAWFQHGLPQTVPEPKTIGALLMLGIFSTALAYMLFFNLLVRVGPTNASTVALILPLAAVFLGVVFLGERFTLTTFSASVLVFAGLVFIDGRLPKRALRLMGFGASQNP